MAINITKRSNNGQEIYYWFIDRASRDPHMVALITPYDRYDTPRTRINLDDDPCNLNTQQSIDILMDLFRQEFLLGIRSGDIDDIQALYNNSPHALKIEELVAKSFIPSHEEVRKAIENEELDATELDNCFTGKELYYFLTPKGGELWESVFKPKWDWYFTRWSTGDSSVINCTSSNIIEKLLSIQHLLSYHREKYSRYLVPDTEIWQTLTPWQALYWKTLPISYSISYQTELIEIDERTNKSQEFREEVRQADEWFRSVQNWYQKDYFNDWLNYPIINSQ
jgi:hypothetical protein